MRDGILGDWDKAARRQPAQRHREDQDQHDPEKEGRHRGPADRDDHQAAVDERIAPDRRDDPPAGTPIAIWIGKA